MDWSVAYIMTESHRSINHGKVSMKGWAGTKRRGNRKCLPGPDAYWPDVRKRAHDVIFEISAVKRRLLL